LASSSTSRRPTDETISTSSQSYRVVDKAPRPSAFDTVVIRVARCNSLLESLIREFKFPDNDFAIPCSDDQGIWRTAFVTTQLFHRQKFRCSCGNHQIPCFFPADQGIPNLETSSHRTASSSSQSRLYGSLRTACENGRIRADLCQSKGTGERTETDYQWDFWQFLSVSQRAGSLHSQKIRRRRLSLSMLALGPTRKAITGRC
jgi:hypothetical protein